MVTGHDDNASISEGLGKNKKLVGGKRSGFGGKRTYDGQLMMQEERFLYSSSCSRGLPLSTTRSDYDRTVCTPTERPSFFAKQVASSKHAGIAFDLGRPWCLNKQNSGMQSQKHPKETQLETETMKELNEVRRTWK